MDLSNRYSALSVSLTDSSEAQISSLPSSPPGDLAPLGFILNAWSFGSDETLRRWSSFIGIVIAICGNILISLALNIQKYAHIRLERESENRRRIWRRRRRWLRAQQTGTSTPDESSSSESSTPTPGTPPNESTGLLAPQDQLEKDTPPPQNQQYLSSPYWWIGFVLMSVGECGNFLAYGFAPASIVSPLGVVALVSNCIIAPVVLKEPLRRRDIIGVIVSILGAVVVVWSAEKEETKVGSLRMLYERTEADGLLDQLGPDQILEAISQTAFEVYFGITCAIIIVLMYLSSKYGRKTILIDLGLVALFGGYTVLSTKGISSLLSSSFYHIFTYPIAYLFTFVLFFTAVLQIKYVNRALQRFDSTQVIPTQFVLFTISVILGSAILYRDFETVKPERMIKFCTGCALTFWGVWLISSRRKDRKWDYDEEEDGDLEGYGAAGPAAGASIDLGRQDGDTRKGKRPRVDSTGFENGIIQEDGPSTPTPSSPMKLGATRPMIARGISSSSMAILDSFPTTPNSRSNSYIPTSPSGRPPSRLASEPILPTQDTPHNSLSRRASRSSAAGGGMHRKSISNLLPGPLVAGYQLKAVMSDFGAIRTRRNSEAETDLSQEVAFLQEAGGRDGGEGRRRSGSLGVVLDLLKRKGRKGLGEEESDTEE